MKKTNAVSQLLLERYNRGKVTDKERKTVENAMASDRKIYNRHEAIKKSDEELRRLYPLENLPRLAAVKDMVVPFSENVSATKKRLRQNLPQESNRLRIKPLLMGIGAAAAVAVVVFFSLLYWIKGRSSNETPAIAESPSSGTDTKTETTGDAFVEDNEEIKEIQVSDEPVTETVKTAETKQKETTRRASGRTAAEQKGTAEKTQIKEKADFQSAEPQSADFQSGGAAIAAAPDTGIRTRGGADGGQQGGGAALPEEQSNIAIPPGITFLFENMFANRNLTFVIIPSRISSIGKNAFAGNPLVSVTIGANVNVHDDAIPGNFAKAYNSYGKAAGTYTRANSGSGEWEKK
ncbi:MAG: leucine-rich repeat domain-containing protein [Treponema sp.]|jgi:cytoskeletal protein RodZ|nr:leucine-rich repeat domain-containing protein [Treponema sp.]